MPGKNKTPRHAAPILFGVLLASAGSVFAQDTGQPAGLVFGTAACSGCHGKADERSRQYISWSQHDAHSRAYATLTTARAARMAEALKIDNATTSARCTNCHAPVQTIAPALRAPDAHIAEGVACASCHGVTGNWLLSHTRPDFTHQDRVASGMRELRDSYHRANACVACHQITEPALVAVGRHPALTFELDGQVNSQPPHWRETAGHDGAQAWFVGQAVALREMSAALRDGRIDASRETPRWQALLWLVQRTGLDFDSPELAGLPLTAQPPTLTAAAELADQVAQRAAKTWAPAQTKAALARLAATHAEFSAANAPQVVQACRAERLVLALDRLLAAQPAAGRPAAASARLDELFRLVQSQPDFVPAKFVRALAAFAQALGG